MKSPDKPGSLTSGFHFRGVLPHLKREGGTYFITFRLAGTLPSMVLLQFRQERERILQSAIAANRPLTWHEQEALFRWYSSRVDNYLDEGRGKCYLGHKACADLVAGALCHFDHQRYQLSAWVIMPNHVHAVVRPNPPNTLSQILHSWKSYTGHEIQNVLNKRVAPFWQQESYDHLARDDDDLHRLCQYVIWNPVSAGLCALPQDWPWSSAHVAQPSSAAGVGTVSVPTRSSGGGTPP
ncbi:MAG TPA: transposase [Verrucomicrobiae bacterium]|nr:transposase [Verrucomicrobiae bacterium]